MVKRHTLGYCIQIVVVMRSDQRAMGPVPLVSAQNSQLSQAVDIWGSSIETVILQVFPLGIYVFVTIQFPVVAPL